MSHTQMLEASQESPGIGLVLEAQVAMVELFTDCGEYLKYFILKGIWQWLKSFSALLDMLPLVFSFKESAEIPYS